MPNIDQILRDVQEKLVSRAKQQLQKRNSESRGRARERARAILTSAFQNNGRITRVNELERLFKPYHLNLGPSDLIALLRTFTGRDSSTTGRANRDCIGNHNQFVFRSAKFVNQVFREEIAYEKSGSVSHSNISEVKKKQQTAGYRKGRMGGGQKSKAAISTRMKKVGEKKGSSVAKDTNGIETTAGEKGPKPTVGLPTRLTSQSQAAGREVGGKVIDVLDTVHFRERQKRSARRTKTPRSGRGDFRADEEKRVKKIDSQTKRDDKYTRPPPLKRAESMTTGSSTNRIQNRKTRKNRITMRISSAQKEKEKATRSDALPSSTVTAPSPSLSSLEQHWQRLQEHEESRGTQQEEGWAQKGERRSMKVVSDVHAAVKSGRLQAFNYTPTSQQLKHPLVGDVVCVSRDVINACLERSRS